MKEYTEKEILNKAEAYCSAVERCQSGNGGCGYGSSVQGKVS